MEGYNVTILGDQQAILNMLLSITHYADNTQIITTYKDNKLTTPHPAKTVNGCVIYHQHSKSEDA
jgi:hypothetical protein